MLTIVSSIIILRQDNRPIDSPSVRPIQHLQEEAITIAPAIKRFKLVIKIMETTTKNVIFTNLLKMSNKLEANVNHNPAISISLDTSEGGGRRRRM